MTMSEPVFGLALFLVPSLGGVGMGARVWVRGSAGVGAWERRCEAPGVAVRGCQAISCDQQLVLILPILSVICALLADYMRVLP
jgi:hypothetical protein